MDLTQTKSLFEVISQLGLVGLAGTLVSVAVTWAKDMNASSRRTRVLDEMTKRIAFWEALAKSGALGEPDSRGVRERVVLAALEAAAAVDRLYADATASHMTREESVSPIRRVLLLYPVKKVSISILRALFYGVLVIAAFNLESGGLEVVWGCLVWMALLRILAALADGVSLSRWYSVKIGQRRGSRQVD